MSDDPNLRQYPEDERLREIQEDPDRRMTRAEWEREESLARQAAHKKHQQVKHDREVQQEFDRKKQGQRHRGKKILLWGGIGLAVLLIVFIIGFIPRHLRERKAAELARQRAQEQPTVEVTKVRRTPTPQALTVPGTTTAVTEAYLYARATGYLRRRYVDIGDHVRKGQLLAVIEAPDLDQQVVQAREQLRQAEEQEAQQQAQLELNRVTWQRWRVLVAKGVFSRQDGDQQQTNYTSQLALVAAAHRNVESTRANLQRVIALQSFERIIAPFDGIVTQRNTDIGALVGQSGSAAGTPQETAQTPSGGSSNVGAANTSGSSGTPSQAATPTTGQAQGGAIFAMAQTDVLRILVSVPEGYAPEIHAGMPAKVFIQEHQNKTVTGTVTRTAEALDQNTRTMLVEVDVDNREGGLYPGMYAVVQFLQVHGVPPLVVPGDAIVIRQDRPAVALVRDQKVQFVPVEIGRDYGPFVEITSGLREGDMVVTTVTDAVQPGTQVRLRTVAEPGLDVAQRDQSGKNPESDSGQYGDQALVNSQMSGSAAGGKGGQGGQGSGGKQGQSGRGSSGKQSKSGSKSSSGSGK